VKNARVSTTKDTKHTKRTKHLFAVFAVFALRQAQGIPSLSRDAFIVRGQLLEAVSVADGRCAKM
jgi:hypothetical protein